MIASPKGAAALKMGRSQCLAILPPEATGVLTHRGDWRILFALRADELSPLDGVTSGKTILAVKAFQKQSGLTESGALDAATLEKLGIAASTDKVNAVIDWIAVPTQEELDRLTGNPVNDPKFPYTDYRPNAPAASLDLPGASKRHLMRGRNGKRGRFNGFDSRRVARYHNRLWRLSEFRPERRSVRRKIPPRRSNWRGFLSSGRFRPKDGAPEHSGRSLASPGAAR
jgi:hypothetical protein